MQDNLSDDRPSFVTHLECSETAERLPADKLAGLSAAGKPLLVRYDLAAVARALSRDKLRDRAPDMWRYREFLPVRRTENIVSLGETMTPLVAAPASAAAAGGSALMVKDEGRLPTGSFKSRGLCVAVSMAKELGLRRIAMPTAGNAGAALAAYCARAGIEAFVLVPDDAPETTISEIAIHGARVYRVDGNITELGPLVEAGREQASWFNLSTLKEPYRVEGKKTMGLELAEQGNWTLPDVIFYPTGGGTGIIGMWKAFAELEAIGWIGPERPRMVAVQSRTCAPIVRAFEEGTEGAVPWKGGHTNVPGLRVPWTVGDRLILRTIRESKGFAIAIDDGEVEPARAAMARADGIHVSPEGAATYVAYRKALAEGRIGTSDRAVLFNCASGLKYGMPPVTARLDRFRPIDYCALVR
ncbi:MAG: threonine synthase [Alphaproteobacteria bacterium]|nr:threonine synthase [Alphaproteobacteria bacterium]